ncbi:MAG: hypothetical protein Q6363_008840 [Candidatus Njordarchaeota archaeon]
MQTVLIFVKRLRRRGITFFVVGFVIKINLQPRFELKKVKLDWFSKITCFLAFSIIFVSIFLVFFWDKVQLIYLMRDDIFAFLSRLNFGEFLVLLWIIALMIGPFHEFMHYLTAKRAHVPINAFYIVAIFGIPIAFAVKPEFEEKDKAEYVSPAQVLATLDGGILGNATLMAIFFLLYSITQEFIFEVLFFFSLYVMAVNSIPFLYYFKTDGALMIIYACEALFSSKQKKLGYRIGSAIVIGLLILQIIFFPHAFYLGI